MAVRFWKQACRDGTSDWSARISQAACVDAGDRTGWVLGHNCQRKVSRAGRGVYIAFFPEYKHSSEPTLASRKRRPNKNDMRTNHQGSSPNKNVLNCGKGPQLS